jgi:hypothetical protein
LIINLENFVEIIKLAYGFKPVLSKIGIGWTNITRISKRSMLNDNFKTLKDYLMFHEAWWD